MNTGRAGRRRPRGARLDVFQGAPLCASLFSLMAEQESLASKPGKRVSRLCCVRILRRQRETSRCPTDTCCSESRRSRLCWSIVCARFRKYLSCLHSYRHTLLLQVSGGCDERQPSVSHQGSGASDLTLLAQNREKARSIFFRVDISA